MAEAKEKVVAPIDPKPAVGRVVHYFANQMNLMKGPYPATITEVHKDGRALTLFVIDARGPYFKDATFKDDTHQGGAYWMWPPKV